MGKAGARRQATLGCPEHRFGCPRTKFLPYKYWEYCYDPSFIPLEGHYDNVDCCLQRSKDLHRWREQQEWIDLEEVRPCHETNQHFRPDHWIENEGKVYMLCGKWFDKRSWEYQGRPGQFKSMGHVRTCVFCDETRGAVRRRMDAFFDDAIQQDFSWDFCTIESKPIDLKIDNTPVQCVVCQEQEDTCVSLDCGHAFGAVCAAEWFSRVRQCPLCRANFSQARDIALIAEEPIEVTHQQCDIALNAESAESSPPFVKRKMRGGKRNRAFIPGLCYLKPIPKKLRQQAEAELGFRPRIIDVDAFNQAHGLEPRGFKVLFVGVGAHVLKRKGWPSALQWAYFRNEKVTRRIGSEDWTPHDEALLRDMTYPVSFFDDYSEDEAILEKRFYEEKPKLVKGGGDCWTLMPSVAIFFKPGREDVTANEIYEAMEKMKNYPMNRRFSWLIETQEDDDFHVAGFSMAKDKPEGYLSYNEVMEKFKGATKLVGAPGTSSVDKASSLLTTPDVRSAMEKLMQPVISENIETSKRLMPYHVKDHLQQKANELSLPWSAVHGVPHDHALHAGIRRWALMTELAKHIQCDFTIIGMKEEHFSMLRSVVRESIKLILINAIVDHKDIGRYAGRDSLSQDVFNLPKITTPGVYFDEQGHYLSSPLLIQLKRDNPGVVAIGYSSIYPLECLEFDASPEPEFVQWEIVKKTATHEALLIYIPEEDKHGAYVQLLDPTPILMNGFTDNKNISFNGGVVAGKAHYRIHMFSSFAVLPQRYMLTSEHNYTLLPKPFYDQPETPPIRVDNLLNLFLYAKVITAKKEENITGKLRLFVREEKMYFPPSALNLTIAVVAKMAEIVTVPDMMSRDVQTTGEEIYKGTIGAMVRCYKRLTTIRRARKNARLIDFHKPYFVYPMVKAVVSCGEGEIYGVKWKPTGEVPGNLWQKLKHWIAVSAAFLIPKLLPPVTMDGEGHLIFPHLANSEYIYRVIGPRFVMESQRDAFNEIFQHRVKPVKAKPAVVRERKKLPPTSNIRYVTKKPTPLTVARLAENPGSDTSDDEEAADADEESEVVSATSSGETTPEPEEPETLPELKESEQVGKELPPDFEAERFFTKPEWLAVAHEPGAVSSFAYFVEQGGLPVLSEYRTFVDAMKVVKHMDHPQQRKVAAEMLKRTHFRARVLKEDGTTNTYPAKRDENSARDLTFIDKIQKRALNLHRQHVLEAIPELPPVVEKYEERKAEWEKLYARRPDNATFTHVASGETFWDIAFQMSSDRRHVKIPYSSVIEYPVVSYPENDCLLVATAEAFKKSAAEIYFLMLRAFPAEEASTHIKNLPLKCLHPVGLKYNASILVVDKDGNNIGNYGIKLARSGIKLQLQDAHIKVLEGIKSLVITRSFPTNSVTIPEEAEILKQCLDGNPLVKWKRWTPERKRASDLVRAYRSGEVGVLEGALNEEKLMGWDALTDLPAPENERYLCVIMGDPGCRKSSPIQALLRQNRFKKLNTWIAIMATKALQDDYRDKVDATGAGGGKKLPGDAIPTLDRMLAKDLGAYIGFTDENKYPKGYHALLGFLVPIMKYLLFMCDPWQSSWHNPVPCSLNDPGIAGEAQYYMQFAEGYVIGTWRFNGLNAAFWRTPSFCRKQCGFHFTDQMPTDHRDIMQFFPKLSEASIFNLWDKRMELYAAHFDTRWAEQLRASDAFSFAGSQGRDAGLTIIEIDDRVIRGSDVHLIYTAMTRSQYILFVRKWRSNGRSDMNVHSHPVFKHLEYYRKAYKPGVDLVFNPEHSVSIREVSFPFPEGLKLLLAGPMRKCTNWADVSRFWPNHNFDVDFVDPDEKRAGARLRRDEPSYVDQPTFQAFIDETENPLPDEPVIQEVGVGAPRLVTKLPVEFEETFKEGMNAQIIERQDAELQMHGQYSSQFPDTYLLRKDSVQKMSKLVNAEPGSNRRLRRKRAESKLANVPKELNPLYYNPQLQNWGANQRNDDAITYAAAARQRLKYATAVENQINYEQQKTLGLACWDAFHAYLGRPGPLAYDSNLMDQCRVDFQERRGDRSEAQKKGSLNRADMPLDQVSIAIKQQWKVKDRTAKAAKPGQPIMTHSDSYLFEHGPQGMYALRQFLKIKPDYYYFHATKTIEDYEEWNSRYMSEEPLSEMTDMTGQDGTTQGWALVFFEQFLIFLGLPEDFINEFVRNKKNKTLRNGLILALMTGSGEAWTLLINSTSAAALEIFKFNIPPHWPVAGTGDDLRRKPGLPVSPEYMKLQHLDPTIIKRFISPRGEFISFMSVGKHVFKDPIILLKRFLAKISMGSGDLSSLGYYDLWKWNYLKGEVLFGCFDESEMAAHQIMTRIMFNLNKYDVHLKPDFSAIRGALHSEDNAEAIADLFEAGDVTVFEKAEKIDEFIPDLSFSRVTTPFNVSGAIDQLQELMLLL